VDELLAAVLASIAESLLEVVFELIAAALLELVLRALIGLFKGLGNAIKDNSAIAGFTYGHLGVLAGG
jgi:hypothetical protein